MSLRRDRRHGERGVSAIIFALMLTVLLTMSAFAVDLGAAFTERRHDQNTADAAVMSAVVESVIGGGVINDVVAEVRDKVDTTLGHPVPAADWTACTDSDQLAYTTVELQAGNPTISPVTQCISFSEDFSRVRVKLPDQDVMAVFGPAVGLGSLQTTASAEAQVINGAGTGAPPFVALSTATQGDFICLRTSSNPQPQNLLNGRGPGQLPVAGARLDPCNTAAFPTSSENFGTLSPYRYLDGCTQQNADVEIAVSLGIDHIMGFYPNGYLPGDPERVDGGAGCTVAFPNTFAIDTGFNAQGLRCALISLKTTTLCNGIDPRFQQGSYVQSTYKFAGEAMDNTAPWDFLRPGLELWQDGAPASCVALATFRNNDDAFDPSHSPGVPDIDDYYDFYVDPVTLAVTDMSTLTDAMWDNYDRYDALVDCLETWDGLSDPELFTIDLGTTPRFAFIPQVAEADLDKVNYVHIESFLPTFMYRMYQATSGSQAACDPLDTRTGVAFFVHDGGGSYSCGSETANVDRLSSIIFACGMVPDELCNKDTGFPDFGGQDIYEFRLVA